MNIFVDFRDCVICKHVGGLPLYVEKEVRLGNNLICAFQRQKMLPILEKTTEKICTCTNKGYCYQKTHLP